MSKPAQTPARPRAVRKTASRAKKARPCVVCGADVAQLSTEQLCWVCRRLKISAWRENDNQAPMNE